MIFQQIGGAVGGLSFSKLSRAIRSLLRTQLPGKITIPAPTGAKMSYVYAAYQTEPSSDTVMSIFLMPGERFSTEVGWITATWSGNSLVVNFTEELQSAVVNVTFFI